MRFIQVLDRYPRCTNTNNPWHAFYFPNTISLLYEIQFSQFILAWYPILLPTYLVSKLRYILRRRYYRHITCHYLLGLFPFLLYTSKEIIHKKYRWDHDPEPTWFATGLMLHSTPSLYSCPSWMEPSSEGSPLEGTVLILDVMSVLL